MYESMSMGLYWLHMASNVYATDPDCHSYAKNRVNRRQQRQLKLFKPNRPLDFVGMDILGLPLRTKEGKKFLVVITDHYTKLNRVVPASSTADTIDGLFLEYWVSNYLILSNVLTDNGLLFSSKVFASVCSMLGVNCLTTNE